MTSYPEGDQYIDILPALKSEEDVNSLLDEAKRSGISAKDILDFLNPSKTTEIKKMGRPRKYQRIHISDIESLEETSTEPTMVVNPSNRN